MITPAQTQAAIDTLKSLGVEEYEARTDGTVYMRKWLILSKKELIKLPDLSLIHVGGDFSCSDNQLTSLAGAPASVGGCFLCVNNLLTSLKGAPASVGQIVYCDGNNLTSLEGAPAKFERLISDFGTFSNPDEIPEELRVSPETRAAQEAAIRQKNLDDMLNSHVDRVTPRITFTFPKRVR